MRLLWTEVAEMTLLHSKGESTGLQKASQDHHILHKKLYFLHYVHKISSFPFSSVLVFCMIEDLISFFTNLKPAGFQEEF